MEAIRNAISAATRFDRALAAEIRAELARQTRASVGATIAPALGLSRQQASRRVNSHVPMTSGEVRTIARALGVSLEELHARAEAALEREDEFLALAAGRPPSPSTTSGVA